MACIHEDNIGMCLLPEAGLKCPKTGACDAIEQSDYDSCEQYESNYGCTDCGADFNVEECTCHEWFCPYCHEHEENCTCL